MAITAAPSDYAGLFHALRATGAAKPVPRGLPPLLAPPGTAPNPWLFWCLGGGLLGVLLSLREPWIERLGHALSLGMWSVVLGGAWRTLRWLLRRRSHAASLEAVGLGSQLVFGLVLVGLPCPEHLDARREMHAMAGRQSRHRHWGSETVVWS